MADPVILTETGMTFDRASILEWLNRGNLTCPLTHQRLQTGQVFSRIISSVMSLPALPAIMGLWGGCEEQKVNSLTA